jgi:hypothetical protein
LSGLKRGAAERGDGNNWQIYHDEIEAIIEQYASIPWGDRVPAEDRIANLSVYSL